MKRTWLALAASCAASCSIAKDFSASIPVAEGKSQATLDAQVYGLVAGGHQRVVLLNHGSSGGHPEQNIDWSRDANYFTQKGYAVLGFMRRGRGKSRGTSRESEEKNCDLNSWSPGLKDAEQDLDAAIEYAQSLPGVDPQRLVLVGMSRGGFLVIAYAAEGRHRDAVGAVINFSGGWVAQAEDRCPSDFNEVSFRKYGTEVKAPTLWLYGAGDLFYGDAAIRRYFSAFDGAGGKNEFHLVAGVPENGHWLPMHQDLWKSVVDDFLQRPLSKSTPAERLR